MENKPDPMKILSSEELRVILKGADLATIKEYIKVYGVLTVRLALFHNAVLGKLQLPRIKGYPPGIFISYRWENEEHKHWVKKLAEYLKTSGFKVYFDQFQIESSHPEDFREVPLFIATIASAQYALIINSTGYIDRVTARNNETSWVYDEFQQITYLVKAHKLKARGILVNGNEHLKLFDTFNMVDLRNYSENFEVLKNILPFDEVQMYNDSINQQLVELLISIDHHIYQNQIDQALSILTTHHEFIDFYEFKLRKMRCLNKMEKTTEAVSIAKEIIDDTEIDIQILYEIIEVLRKGKTYSKAIRKMIELRKALKQRSTFNTRSDTKELKINFFDTYPALIEERDIIACHFMFANLLDDQGGSMAAINHYTYILKYFKENESKDKALILNNIGYCYNKIGHYEDAIKVLKVSLHVNDNAYMTYENLAVSLSSLAYKNDFIVLLNDMLQRFPSLKERIVGLRTLISTEDEIQKTKTIKESLATSFHCDHCNAQYQLDLSKQVVCGDCGNIRDLNDPNCTICLNDGTLPLFLLKNKNLFNMKIACPTCLQGAIKL